MERRFQALNGVVESGNAGEKSAVVVAEFLRRGEPVRWSELSGFFDAGDEPLAEFARGVLAVPVEFRCERRVVAVSCRRLLLFELRQRTDIGPQQSSGFGVFVGGDGNRMSILSSLSPTHRKAPMMPRMVVSENQSVFA